MPQQHYDDTTEMLHDIRLPDKRAQSLPKKVTGMAYILGSGGANLFNTPVRNVTDGAGHGTPSNSIITPFPPGAQKMSVFFDKQSNKVKFGYFVKLEFLDNQ